MKTTPKSLFLFARLAFVLAVSTLASRAQNGINASGVLTFVPGAGNTYDYTLTIHNSASSSNPIGSFWYAWLPGEFFLPTQPSSDGTPPNWSANFVTIGASSIQFSTTSSPARIAPGSSLSFTFVSTDTPTVLAGNAFSYPTTPIGTSVAYANGIESDPGDTFVVVSVVPEPSFPGLLAAGFLGLLVMGWHQRRICIRPVAARA